MTEAAAAGPAGALPPKPLWERLRRFHQIGFVVPDLPRAIAEMSAVLGVDPDQWRVFDSGQPFEHHEGAGAVAVVTRYARVQSGPTAYQLLEPVTAGTVWQRWLDAGTRQFAVGYFVPDLGAEEAAVRQVGGQRLAWGRIFEDGTAFSYSFFRLPETGVVIELIGLDAGVPPADEIPAPL